MAFVKRFPHKFTIGTRDYITTLPDFYESNGSTIGSTVGLDKITSETNIPEGTDTVDASDALLTAKLIRFRISYKDGATGKTKNARILCSADKAKTAIGALLGKQYRNGEIVGVGIPRRRRLG